MIFPKTTILTLVIAIAAIGAAVLTSGMERGARSGSGDALLLTSDELRADSVERIILDRRGEARLVFERSRDGAWLQVEPFPYPMDAAMLHGLASAAREVRVVDRIAKGEFGGNVSLSTIGLDPPEAILTFASPEGHMKLELGRRGIAGRAYARLENADDVLIVTQELHDRAVEMSPKEWRDRLLLRSVGIDCDRIVREDGATRLMLERDRRTWRMIEPVRTRVDQAALERFLQALGGARSAGFIADQPPPDSLARFGLAPGRAAASLSVICTSVEAAGDAIARIEHEQRLLIGNPAGAGTHDRFGMIEGRPTVVRVPIAALQGLFVNPVELIDPTGSGVVAADVKSVRIMSAAGEVRLERDLDRWFATRHGNREVAAALVQDALTKLTEFRAPGMEIREYPRELEKAVVTLFGFDGRPIDTVRILHHEDTGQWALENGDDVLRVFPKGFEVALTAAEFGLGE